jgi:hypothetical protein
VEELTRSGFLRSFQETTCLKGAPLGAILAQTGLRSTLAKQLANLSPDELHIIKRRLVDMAPFETVAQKITDGKTRTRRLEEQALRNLGFPECATVENLAIAPAREEEKREGAQPKRCERCPELAQPGERFCKECRKAVLEELQAAGYLTPAPYRLGAWSSHRGREAREDERETRRGRDC